jgi:hypothetical protein
LGILSSGSWEFFWPALLLGPNLLIVCFGVDFQLFQICVDNFFSAVGALESREQLVSKDSTLSRHVGVMCLCHVQEMLASQL